MIANCRWCRRRPATQLDHDTLPEGDDGDLCWREWSDPVECHVIEDRMKDAVPEMLEAIEYQLDLNQWIESADCESPFFEETLTLRLNTANDYFTAAIAKAKGGNP